MEESKETIQMAVEIESFANEPSGGANCCVQIREGVWEKAVLFIEWQLRPNWVQRVGFIDYKRRKWLTAAEWH